MSKAKQPSNIAKSGITSVRSEESQRDKYINSFVSARLGGATASEAHSTAANKALKDVIKANQNKTSRIQEGLANGTMYEKDGRYYYTDEAQNQYVKSAAEQYADRLQATQAQNAWEGIGGYEGSLRGAGEALKEGSLSGLAQFGSGAVNKAAFSAANMAANNENNPLEYWKNRISGIKTGLDSRLDAISRRLADALIRADEEDEDTAKNTRKDAIIDTLTDMAILSAGTTKDVVSQPWALSRAVNEAAEAITGSDDVVYNQNAILNKAGAITKPLDDYREYVAARQQLTDNNAVQIAGNAATTIANMVPSIGISLAAGPEAGTLSMAMAAGGNESREAYKNGATLQEATQYGNAKEIIEWSTEHMFGGINGLAKGVISEGLKNKFIDFAHTALGKILLKSIDIAGENVEEGMSDFLAPAAERVYLGSNENDTTFKQAMLGQAPWTKEGIVTLLTTFALNGLNGAVTNNIRITNEEAAELLDIAHKTGDQKLIAYADKLKDKVTGETGKSKVSQAKAEDLKEYIGAKLKYSKTAAQAYADAIQDENNQKKAEAEKNAAIQNFVKGTEAEGSDVTQTIDKDAVRSNYGGKERTVSMVRVDGQNLMKLTDTADNTAVAMTFDEVRENDALPDDVRIFASMLDSKLGENAPAAYEAYDGNMSTGEYAIAMHEAINLYAGNGADLTETVKKLKSGENVGSPVAKLNSAQIFVAQSAGNKIYQQKKLDMNSLRTKYADQAKAIQQARETSAADIRKIDTSIAEVNGEIKKAGENLAEANRTLSGLQEGTEEYRQAQQQVTYWQNYITQAEEALNVLNSAKMEAQNKAPVQRAKGTVSYAGAEGVNSDYKPVDKNNLTKKQSKAIKAVEVLADHFSLKFVLFDGDSRGDQGKFEHIGDDGTIYINVNAGGGEMVGIAGTLSHELTHTMQQYSPADYEDLKNEILKIYFNNDPALFERRVRFYMSSQGLDYDSAVDEIIANTCTTMLRDSDAIAQLARDNMNLAQKILDTLRNIVKEAFEDFRAARAEEKLYEEYRDQFDEVIRLWESGIRNAASNYNNGVSQSIKNTAPESGVKLMAWESDDTSTSIDTDPNKHSASDMARINSYVASVDKSLKNVFVKYYNDPKSKFSRHKISDASERQIKDAEKLLGQNFEGYTNSINSNSVKHIISEHGPDGSVNHSLRNLNDAARIGYILDNYDSVELGTYASGDAKYSDEFRDRNNNPSSILKYSKKIDGTYYVVEAAAENNYKKFWVVSAYIEENKKSVTQAPDANGPENTPKASLASPLDLNIAEPEKAVKENATGQFQKYVDGQISMDELQAEDEYAARYIREGYHPAIAERLAEGDRIRDKLTRFFARLPDYEGKPTAEDIDNAIDVNPYSDAISGYMNSADELLNDIAYAVEWGFVPEKSKNTAFGIMEQMLNQMSTQLQVDWEATYHGKPKFREFAEWYEKHHGKGNSTYTVSEDMRRNGGVNRRYQKWEEAAVKQFGTTEDFAEAGYILPDGRMLRFTNDKNKGTREYDHRAIALAYGENVDLNVHHGYTKSGNYLERFVDGGNIRIEAGDPDLDIDAGLQLSATVPPTAEQMQTIRDFLKWQKLRDESFVGDEYSLFKGTTPLGIDFGGNSNIAAGESNKDSSRRYVGNFNPEKIINDIKEYYRTGAVPEQSVVSQFHSQYQKFDSDGNELSNQQAEFFAGSKARAGDGRLLKLYHGTMDYGFTVFDNRYSDDRRSFFMTDSLDMAQSYSDTNIVRSAVRGDSDFKGREIADAINRADPGTISGYEQEDIPAVISWDKKEIANASKEAAKFLRVFDDYVKDVYTGGTIGERRKKTIDAAREQLRTIAEYDADNPGNALKLLDGYKKDNILDLEYLIGNLADEGDISVPEQKYDGLSLIEFLRYAKELDKAYSINKNGGGMYLRLTGWNGGIELYSEDELKDYYFTQYGRRGNYPLYANITNPMELDAHGNNWNFIQWDGNTKYSERREQLLAELDALAAEGYEFDPLKLMMKEIQDIEFTDIERRANDIYEELSEIGDRGINIGKKNWTTRELSKYANENGYDGVIIRNVHDSGGRGKITPDAATVVIAFYPEQIKDAENKNPTNNPDIRFQKWDSGAGDTAEESRERVRAQVRIEYENQLMHDTISSLNKELEKLQAKYEKQGLKSGEKISELKRELKLTKTPEVRKADAKKIAKAYIEKANSTADTEQITEMFVDLGNYIVQGTGETLDEDVIVKKAHNIAELLVEKASVKDTSGMEAYQKLASDIKGRKFVLPEEDRGDLDIEGGYDRFRKKNFGRFMLVNEGGTPVSTAYAELQNAYGTSLLPDVRNQGDMIRIMADVFDLADPDEINPFSNAMAQAAAEFTNDIIYEVLGEELRQKAPTFADKAKAKQDALKAENKELSKELKAETREANREKTRLEKALDKTERQLARVKAEKDAKIAELKEKGTARVQQARAKEKAAKWAKVKEVRDLYRERERTAAEKRKESAGISKYRKQVIEKAGKLYELVTVNSDKKHVPKVLRGPLAEFLESINFDSKQKLSGGENTQADDKFGTKLQRLHNILSKQQEFLDGDGTKGVDLGGYVDISQESLEYLRIMSEGVTEALDTGREFTINTMTAEELKGLSRFLTGLTRAISNMNTFLANEAFKDIGDVAGSDMRHMQKLGSAKSGVNRGVSKLLNWKNATPYYAMQRFGEGGKSIFRSLVKGWGKMAMNVKTIEEFTDKTYTRKEVNSWKNDVHEFTLSDGNKIKMTTAQIMELSMLLEREQAVKHIDHGGIRIGDISTNKDEVNDTKHYHLSSEDILNIIGKLSDRQMQVANELRTFMAEYGAELGNEVSMARFGYEFYDEGPKYYPIKTDSNDRALSDKDENKNSSMFRLLNLSASKSLKPNASNALVVGDIFDTFADHMADMAKLNGLGLPVLDAIKWFNYKERTDLGDGQYDVEGMMAAMEEAFGKEAPKYIRTLIKDINGVHESGERGGDFWGKLSSNYKVSAVAANLRVALLQPTAYVRSSFILKPQYLAGAFGMKNGYQEALKHSGTAQWKSMGYYDTNISRNMREQIEHDDSWKDRLVEGSMKLAELGDQLTWGRLWNACKLQTKAETGLSGEELNRKTAELFDEVIYATQVMDSTLTRSELMRSASSYDKMFTAFMAEPTVSYNLLLDAFSKYSLDVRKNGKANALGRNSGTIMKAFAVYAASSAFSAIVESFADAVRDDDDEEFYEKFLQAFLGEGDNAIERFYDGNLGSDLSFVGKIPFAKDIISTIQGYGGTSNMSSEGIQTIVDAVRIWEETIKLETGALDKPTKTTYYGKMTGWGKVYKTLQGLSQLSGIPASAALRDVFAIWNNFAEYALEEPGWKITTYDADKLSGSSLSTYKEYIQPTGMSEREYTTMLDSADAAGDGNGSVKQDELGYYLMAAEKSGELSSAQIYAIWASKEYKTSYQGWKAKHK